MTLSITLEARNPERKCWRSYHVAASRDLFDMWIVEICFGRIGAGGRGRVMSHVFDDESDAKKKVRDCLMRRRTAEKRLGAPYLVKNVAGSQDWLDIAGSYDPIIVRQVSGH